MKQEIITTIGELQDGDEVLGADGKWYQIEILPVVGKPLYNLTFSNGCVVASFDHEWTIFDRDNVMIVSTADLFSKLDYYKGKHVGVINGPTIQDIEYVGFEECRCISVDNEDHQFMIYTSDGNEIFTHNCQGRMVCGRLNTTASMMALGNSLATTIDGDRKGAGIVSVNGIMSNIQYYFESPEWLDKWYEDRGMDKNGFEIGASELNEREIILEGEEDLTIPENLAHYEFEDIEKDINNNKQQKFENV